MNIILQEHSDLPIYQQIIQSVKQAIVNKELVSGDMLPSIRSLARGLNISVITTKRAYEELEKQGLIYSLAGKGFFVKDPDLSLLKEEQLKQLETQMTHIIEKSREIHVSLEELQEMIGFLWKEMDL